MTEHQANAQLIDATTARFKRSLSEAFPSDRAHSVTRPNGTLTGYYTRKASKWVEFVQVYRLYRRAAHGIGYSLRTAWNIVYSGHFF